MDAHSVDAELLLRAGRGDARAFEAIYDRHSGPAWALACGICGDEALAQDVMQEAFVSAWRRAGTYDARRGTARAWILGIVRDRALHGTLEAA